MIKRLRYPRHHTLHFCLGHVIQGSQEENRGGGIKAFLQSGPAPKKS